MKKKTSFALAGIGGVLFAALLLFTQNSNRKEDWSSEKYSTVTSDKPHTTSIPAPNRSAKAAVPKFKPSGGIEGSVGAFDAFERSRVEDPTNRRLTIMDLFANEARDPVWAPKMEALTSARFERAELEKLGFKNLKADKVECKTETCRLEVSFDAADLAQSETKLPGEDPLTVINSFNGPFGDVLTRPPLHPGQVAVPKSWNIYIRDDGRYGATMLMLFSPEFRNPDNYARKVSEGKESSAQFREARARARASQ